MTLHEPVGDNARAEPFVRSARMVGMYVPDILTAPLRRTDDRTSDLCF